MYDTILVPTDGSEPAVRAAEHGLALAAAFDAQVHVITVVDVQGASGPFSAGGVDDEFVDHLKASGREAIETIESLAAERDAALETAIVEGDPRETILTYVEDHGIDLVAMGTHGRTGVERYLTGSVCEHVLRNASVPVLTGRATETGEPAGSYDDVLIPTDGSGAAEAAVAHGIAIADAVDARVHAVNVIDLGDVSASSELTIPSDLIDSLQDRGEDATDAVVAAAEDAGLEAVTEVRGGFPAQDLLEYADEEGIDLISMGTAGRTGISRFLMGSTTERVVRHADVPVVSVNAGDADETNADR